MNNPMNRSNHRGVPRTKIEHTISLRLIHTYSVDDPAVLCRLELDATGVERREEQPFSVRWRLDLQERREGQPRGKISFTSSHQGGASPHLFIEGRGGHLGGGGTPKHTQVCHVASGLLPLSPLL